MPYPLPLTRTEAYLAYKAGVIQQSDLKPSLAVSRNGIDEWLAYWTGLAADYPKKPTVNLFDKNKITVGVRVSTSNGGTYPQAGYAISSFIPVSPLTTYVLVCGTAAGGSFFSWYDSSKHYISGSGWQNKMAWKSPANARYIKFDFKESEKDIVQFEKAPLSPYSPYTNEPLILQEEEAYIAYLCGVINEYPEKCLRRVGAYLRYLISARWGRPDHPLNREELYLSLIKTQFIPSGDPSSDITIDGTAKAPFVDVKMYGDTFQQSYTGKNLYYDTDGYKQGFLGNSGEINSTVESVTNATYIEASENTQYVMSFNDLYRGITFRGIAFYDANKNFISRALPSHNSFTTPQNTAYIRVYFYNANGLDATNFPTNYISDIQLELGSTATSFEPFVGGQPSPNPSYPQPIQTVTGEQTVTVVGKNLFDKNNASLLLDGLYIGSTNMQSSNQTASLYIPCEPNTTYTVSKDSTARFACATTAELPAGGVSIADRIADFTATSITITTSSTAKYLVVFYYHNSYDTKSKQQILDSIQIEVGSQATAYAPYSKQTYTINLGSIELCKLGTYQDYIWKDGDDWKVHKATSKVSLDGSESWSRWITPDENTIETRTFTLKKSFFGELVPYFSPYAGIVNTAKSDRFTVRNTVWDNTILTCCALNGDNTRCLQVKLEKTYLEYSDSMTTAELEALFKAWLVNKPTALYYALATATDTTITDTTLIAQLDSLVNGGAEDGTTYIKVSATDPNLPGLLYVEAPKYE